MKNSLLFLLVFLIFSTKVFSQKKFEEKLILAKDYYANGNFSESLKSLEEYKDSLKLANSEYYKLKAKLQIAQDSSDLAKGYIVNYIHSKSGNYIADDDPQLFKDLFREIEDSLSEHTITSVSKRAEDIDLTPASVIVLKDEEISKRGYVDLVDLLSDQPGFDISRIYSVTYANVFQRGFRQENTERTLLMIDGIEENDIWSNIAYISRQYPLSNISSVEIIYGPASTVYGPRAFVGAVNIITKSYKDLVGKSSRKAKNEEFDIRVNAKALGGTYATKGIDVSVGGKKKKTSFLVTAKVFSTDERDLSGVSFYDYNADDIDRLTYDTAKTKALMYVNNPSTATNELSQVITKLNLVPGSPYYNYFSGYGTDTLKINPDSVNAMITKARQVDKSRYNSVVNGNKVGFSNSSFYYYVGAKIKTENFEAGVRTWKNQEGFILYQDLYAAGTKNGSKWIPLNTTFYTIYDKRLDNLNITNTSTYVINSLDKNTDRVTYNSFFGLLNPNPYSSLSMFNILFPDSLIDGKKQGWQNTYYYYTAKQFRNDLRANYSKNNLNVLAGIECRSSQLQGDYLLYNSFAGTEQGDQSKGAFASTLGTVSNQDKGSNQYSALDLGLYSQLTWKAIDSTLFFTAGGRYDYNRIRSNDGFKGIFDPKFAVIFSKKYIIAKLIYSRGIQGPSQWTKYSTGGGRTANGTLKPEKIQNIEFVLQNRHGLCEFAWDAAGFYSIIQDAIASGIDPADNKKKNLNSGKYTIFGVQANVNYVPLNQAFSIYSNYSYTKASQTDNSTVSGFETKTIADIASFKSNLVVNYHLLALKHDFNFNLRTNFVSTKQVGSKTTVEKNTGIDNTNKIPAYLIFAGTILYKNKAWDKISIQFTVSNILGRNILDSGHTDYYSPGPRTADGNQTDNYSSYVPWVPQHTRSYFITLNFNL